MAGVLPSVKRYMESTEGPVGWAAKRVSLEELKALTDKDREDFREMLAAVGVECDQ